MNFSIEHEQEADGRWLAEVPELPSAWNKEKAALFRSISRLLPTHESMAVGQGKTRFGGTSTHRLAD
jgi:hypothetical protein